MATGILEVLRAAMDPLAKTRTGYLQGKDFGTQRKKAESRQSELDRLAADDRKYARDRDEKADKRQGLLDESRIAYEKAQAGEAADRGKYYRSGGRSTVDRTSGDRSKARTNYILKEGERKFNPDTGQWEPGRPASVTGPEFDNDVWPIAKEPPPVNSGGGMAAMRSRGAAQGPVSQTRAAMSSIGPTTAKGDAPPVTSPTGPTGPSGKKAPKTTIDSSALAKKYPYLYK